MRGRRLPSRGVAAAIRAPRVARWPPAVDTEREKDREMLTRAATLRAPLAKAARLAASNGMGYLVFGALTVLLSLSTDVADLAAIGVGVTLLYVGSSTRRLAPRLSDGDAAAARALARNELVLFGAISIYDMAGLARAFYAVVFVITLLYQGGLARHFRRLVPTAEAYVAEVPEWAREAVASLPH